PAHAHQSTLQVSHSIHHRLWGNRECCQDHVHKPPRYFLSRSLKRDGFGKINHISHPQRGFWQKHVFCRRLQRKLAALQIFKSTFPFFAWRFKQGFLLTRTWFPVYLLISAIHPSNTDESIFCMALLQRSMAQPQKSNSIVEIFS